MSNSSISFSVVEKPVTADEKDILVHLANRRMVITLNRPETLNRLTLPMLVKFYEILKDVRDNHIADLVILKSSIQKAFCAGGDVLEVLKSVQTDGDVHKKLYAYEYLISYCIGTLQVPFVVLIQGISLGAGFAMTIQGRFRVVTERTTVFMPEVAVGLCPDGGTTYVFPRLQNQLGMFLALTGYRLKGADVYHSGMATHYVNSHRLAELEAQLLLLPSPTNRNVETVLKSFQPSTIPAFSLAPHLSVINTSFSAESLEKVIGELRRDGSKFALEQIETMLKMNPISLKVTFSQLKQGLNLQFAEVFAIEYRLIQRLVTHPNFTEACRALFIDKDHKPRWCPSDIKDVSDEVVRRHFEILPNEFSLNAKFLLLSLPSKERVGFESSRKRPMWW